MDDEAFSWAVCPPIGEEGTTECPRLFRTATAAKRFWNTESLLSLAEAAKTSGVSTLEVHRLRRERIALRKKTIAAIKSKGADPRLLHDSLRKITNRKKGWTKPIPIKWLRDLQPGQKNDFPFREFLRVESLGEPAPICIPDLLQRSTEERSPDFECLLGDDWRFEALIADAMRRVGHEYEGRKHASISEIVWKALDDLDRCRDQMYPNLTREATADFWASWQVHNYLAQFCSTLSRSHAAKVLAGNVLDALESVTRAKYFFEVQLTSLVHSVRSDANRATEAIIGSTSVGMLESDHPQLDAAVEISRSMGSDAAVKALFAFKERKGWTMGELARHLDTSARTLLSFRKRCAVRSSVFRAIADRLGITAEDFLSGNLPGPR